MKGSSHYFELKRGEGMENIFGENTKKLGFGLMRLPELSESGRFGKIDIELTKKMVDYFLSEGFTYFDTAWMYCESKSEDAAGEALVSRHKRDEFTLATKLHCGFFNNEEEREKIFKTQLEKTRVDHFDYYLLHDLGEDHYKKYQKFGCFEWLADKKKAGYVKHMGFSYHDRAELLDRILTEHPEVEFVQLQLNYLDWESEAIQSRKCYEVCVKHSKPVIVMEPVKGGTLSNVVPAVEKLFKSHSPEMSVASWAIRFAASQPNVKMVLSGMGNMDMMRDNTGYMKDFVPLDDEEFEIVKQATNIINSSIAIPCTACGYCVDGCPKNIPIPKYFSLYNAELQEYEGKGFTPQKEYYARLAETHGRADDCIECGKCEKICPQHLPIRKNLKLVASQFSA